MSRFLWVLLSVLCLSSSGLSAQVPAAGEVTFTSLYDPNFGMGDAQGAVLEDDSGVVVAVDDKTQTATIQFVSPGPYGKLSLTISAAVDQDTGTATFVGFNQPVGDEQAKLEYNYIRWPEFSLFELFEGARPGSYRGGEVLDALLSKEAMACRDAIATLKQRLEAGLRRVLWSGELETVYREVEELELPTREEVEAYLKRTEVGGPANMPTTEEEKKTEAKVQKLIQGLEQDKGICFDLETLMPHLYSVGVVTRGELTDRRRAMLFGLNGSVGRKEFSFLNRDLLRAEDKVDTASEQETPVSVGARFGWIFLTQQLEADPESSLIFSYNRERGYEAADDLTFCQPTEGLEEFPLLQTCKEIAGAAPSSTDADFFSIEYRQKYRKVSLAVRGFYRSIDEMPDDKGIEIPIYFLTNREDGFQGGVSVGWRDQTDDVTIAVFVGRQFEIF